MPLQRIKEFEQWQPSYNAAVVKIFQAGTTTLASVFTDEALTIAAPNPQTLLSFDKDGVSYGKFAQPLYTSQSYQLDVNGGNRTGTQRPPLTTLVAQDASKATVIAEGGSMAVALDSVVSRVIYASDYGDLGEAVATATNTATLTAAIGKAGQNNGGLVCIPSGNFQFSKLTIPAGVVLIGQGKNSTTLRSQVADKAITLAGEGAGLCHLTLDGVDVQVGSIGVYAKAINETVLHHCLIKRFETGIHCHGGRRSDWVQLSLDSCNTGAKLHGDNDAGNGANGDEFRSNSWLGGLVKYCTVIGVELSFEDEKCWFNSIENVGFEDCAGIALNINGARWTSLKGCWWTGNTQNIKVDDDDDTDRKEENTVIGLNLVGGSIEAGSIDFIGTCQDIGISDVGLFGVVFNLTLPTNTILLRNCVEDAGVTLTGDGSKLTRWRDTNHGSSSGLTTDAVATKAWGLGLEPGQVGYFEGKVLANQKNGISTAEYHIAVSANRAGSQLAYDTQVANFTLGEVLTGAVSGAQALILADTDGGSSGTLTLRNIVGDFQNNEQITDPLGGDALANGTLVSQSVSLKGAVLALRAAREDAAGLDATFIANGSEIELQVTGEVDKTYEWMCHVSAVLT